MLGWIVHVERGGRSSEFGWTTRHWNPPRAALPLAHPPDNGFDAGTIVCRRKAPPGQVQQLGYNDWPVYRRLAEPGRSCRGSAELWRCVATAHTCGRGVATARNQKLKSGKTDFLKPDMLRSIGKQSSYDISRQSQEMLIEPVSVLRREILITTRGYQSHSCSLSHAVGLTLSAAYDEATWSVAVDSRHTVQQQRRRRSILSFCRHAQQHHVPSYYISLW